MKKLKKLPRHKKNNQKNKNVVGYETIWQKIVAPVLPVENLNEWKFVSASRCLVKNKYPEIKYEFTEADKLECENSRHCDDYIDDKTQEKCLRRFLRYCRWPAIFQFRASRLGIEKPPLYADFKFQRVKVVMASRFGDVGITGDLDATHGYDLRVPVSFLSNFSDIHNA